MVPSPLTSLSPKKAYYNLEALIGVLRVFLQ